MPSFDSPLLHHHRLWLLVGHCLLAALVVVSLAPSAPPAAPVVLGDKIGHLVAYAVLMLWYGQIIGGVRRRALLGLGLVLLGVLLEVLQGWGGARTMEVHDAVANMLGVGLGWLLVHSPLGGGIAWLDARLGR